MHFPTTWSALQDNLTAGTKVRNWTADNGFLGDDFSVTAVTSGYVDVDSPGAHNIQTVAITDFEAVYNVWPSYCRGQVSRSEIRDATRFSKYVISILHWLEVQCGGQLP